MDEKMEKRAALYMLIKLVDENNGNLAIGNDKVKRVFNDEDDIVRIEYTDGKIGLLADADFETMDDAIHNWRTVS